MAGTAVDIEQGAETPRLHHRDDRTRNARFVHRRPGSALGRRKEAVARVRLVPGTGTWKVNGRALKEYFPNKVHRRLINSPLSLVEVEGSSTSSPASRVAARRARPALCAWASPVR